MRNPLEKSLDESNEIIRNLTAKQDRGKPLSRPEARTLARARSKAASARRSLQQQRGGLR